MPRNNKRNRRYCFTVNNYTVEIREALIKSFENLNCEWIFQEETGDTGTPHLQGFVQFKTQKVFSTLKNLCRTAHWEVTRATTKLAVAYCMKVSTRTGELYTNMNLPKQLESPLKGKDLYQWQKKLWEELSEAPDDRSVLWIWEADGNAGKTAFAKHLVIMKPDKVIYVSGKANDVKYAVAAMVEKGNYPEIVIYAVPRSANPSFVSYGVLESVKDGMFFSGKYESGMCLFPNPHVMVLANFPPDESKLSADRWSIRDIDNCNWQ